MSNVSHAQETGEQDSCREDELLCDDQLRGKRSKVMGPDIIEFCIIIHLISLCLVSF